MERRSIFLLVLVVSTTILATLALIGAPASIAQRAIHPIPPSMEAETAGRALHFIENVGQFDERVLFQVNGASASVHLTQNAIWLTQLQPEVDTQEAPSPVATPDPSPASSARSRLQDELSGVNVKISFASANPRAKVVAFDRAATDVSYFRGSDPEKWRTEVPVWAGVRYASLYPGVDLIVTGAGGAWNWQLQAEQAEDLKAVSLEIQGAENLSANEKGQLLIDTGLGIITGPSAKLANGEYASAVIEGEKVLFAQTATVGRSEPVENTPRATQEELLYSTFFGGTAFDEANAIAAGTGGASYLTGRTYSWDFPTTPGVFSSNISGNSDIFVSKLESGGDALVYCTFLGGSNTDQGHSLAINGMGEVVIAGTSYSSDFPTTAGAFDRSYNQSADIVVAKLGADGTTLDYATYVGGSGIDLGLGVDVDGSDATYVTGHTSSANFPTTAGAFDTNYGGGYPFGDSYVLKLNPGGSSLNYSTFLGGTGEDYANDMAVSQTGQAYVVGWTNSNNFPVTGGSFSTGRSGHNDVFLVKVNSAGGGLIYAGLLGGIGDDQGQGVAVDIYGEAYIAGQTNSSDFPVTAGAFQTSKPSPTSNWDGFVAKVNATGNSLIYNTYLGGSNGNCETVGIDRECSIDVDSSGVAYVAGRTQSTNFPTTPGGYDTTFNGNEDGFMVRLNPAGSGLLYGSFFGGSDSDQTLDVSVDTAGSAHISGRTYSLNFPSSAGAYDTTYNGSGDAFAVKLFVGGYVSGPKADPDRSTINASPQSVTANGEKTSTITVRLLGKDGMPAWGKTVRVSSVRGPLDDVSQPTTVTDSQGYTHGTIRSTTEGTANIYALVLDDGVLLTDSVAVNFEPYTPPSEELIWKIRHLSEQTINSLERVSAATGPIADDGDYFRGAIDADKATRIINGAFNMAGIIQGAGDWRDVHRGMGVGLPGMKHTDGPFASNVLKPSMYKDASHLFRTNVWYLLQDNSNIWEMREELAYTGMKFYAAQLRNSGLKAVSKGVAIDVAKEIFVSQENGMSSIQAPAAMGLVNDLSEMIDVNHTALLDDMPNLSLLQQDAYGDDLTSRTRAIQVMGNALDNERLTLDNFRQSHDDPDLRNKLTLFLLRWVAKSTAKAAFDGPGTIVVGGTLATFDWYMDSKRIEESGMMAGLARDTLDGTANILRQIYSDGFSGLDRIAQQLPAEPGTGVITGLRHRSQGGGWKQFWKETASWSEVSLKNTGSTETTFLIYSEYLADTTRFGVPWNTLFMVDEISVKLAPGASKNIRVDYKRDDGAKGFSPREGGCLIGFGCYSPSNVTITVLGDNGTGIFYIDNDSKPWNPERATLTGEIVTAALNYAPTVDPPITSYVLSAPWTQEHEAQIWLNNPFDSTVVMTASQKIPDGVLLVDAGGATQKGDTLEWVIPVDPASIDVVTFTFEYPAQPDTVNVLSPATLDLVDPMDGVPMTAESNEVEFSALWPVSVEHTSPGYVVPGSSDTVDMAVTNWIADHAVSGNVFIRIEDKDGATVYDESAPFTVGATGTATVQLTIPAALAKGNYLIFGDISINGVKANLFFDWLQVGLPGPALLYTADPLGTVEPGQTIAYTMEFSNTTDVTLHNTLLTASLPPYTTIVPSTISSAGKVVDNEVHWQIGNVNPGERVTASFKAKVDPDAAPVGGQARRLTSEGWLVADELNPTPGTTPWHLVEPIPVILLPIVLSNS